MKRIRLRVILKILLIPLIMVAVALTILTFVLFFIDSPSEALFTGISAVAGWLIAAFAWANRKPEAYDIDTPLNQAALTQIHPSRIPWIDRPIPSVQQWTTTKRLVITGIRDMGKTRAVATLLQRAIDAEKIKPDRIFVPTPALLRLDENQLKRKIADICSLQSHTVVFIEDLPRHYQRVQLERLVRLFDFMAACGSTVFVIADGRTNELEAIHNIWLSDNEFDTFSLERLSAIQLRGLIERATNTGEPLQATLEDGVIDVLIEAADGTPEKTLAPLRLLTIEQGQSVVSVAAAREAARQSTTAIWRETIAYLARSNSAVRYLADAIAAFHAARLSPYYALIEAYAVTLWQSDVRRPRLQQKQAEVSRGLQALEDYEITLRGTHVTYPDVFAEAWIENEYAPDVDNLRAFLRQYRFPRRIDRLRVITPNRDQQLAILLDLAQWFWDDGESDTALTYCDAILAITPIKEAYFIRAKIYGQQGADAFAIDDYTRAIEIDPEVAAAYHGRGIVYRKQGNHDLALADYTRAIEIDPEFAAAYTGRGYVYRKQGNLAQAFADFNRAIEIDPELAAAYANRGSVYWEQDNPAQALADFNRAIEIDPEFAAAYKYRGDVYSEQGNHDLALADFNRAIDIDPEFAYAYQGRGIVYSEQGNHDLALADFNRAIDIDPEFAYAYLGRGNVYSEQGNHDLALADFNRAIDIDPEFAYAYQGRGIVYSEQGNHDLALADYNRAIDIDPEFAYAYHGRGIVYSEQGNHDLALADFNRAIDIDPEFAYAYQGRGIVYSEQGNHDLALADFNRAIDIDPEFAYAYHGRGIVYSEQGNHDLALADFNRAIDIDPEYAYAYQGRGIVYREQGNHDLALADYNRAIDIDPEFAYAYQGRGIVYSEQGNHDLALADYNRAIDIDPEFAYAYHGRGIVYREQGNHDLALADFNRAIDIDPEYAYAYHGRGIVYSEQGNHDLALADFNRAIDIDPEFAYAYQGRGIVYSEQGNHDLALADFNRAIDIDPEYAYAYHGRGLLQLQLNNIESGAKDIERALRLDSTLQTNNPRIAAFFFEQAQLLLSLQQFDAAFDILSTVVTLDPLHARAFKSRGDALAALENHEGAVADYTTALQKGISLADQLQTDFSPARRIDFTAVHFNRGLSYAELAQYKEAVADFDYVIKRQPTDVEARYERALIYIQQGRYAQAREDLLEVIRFASDVEMTDEAKELLSDLGSG